MVTVVNNGTTIRTDPFSVCQFEFFMYVSTEATGFGTRVPFVDFDELFAPFFQFVFEEVPELYQNRYLADSWPV